MNMENAKWARAMNLKCVLISAMAKKRLSIAMPPWMDSMFLPWLSPTKAHAQN